MSATIRLTLLISAVTATLVPSALAQFVDLGLNLKKATAGISGTTVVVAGELASGNGACYVVDATTGDVVRELLTDQGVPPKGVTSIRVSGSTAVVGAPGLGTGAVGEAYLFDVQSGIQIARLSPVGGTPFDGFGWSVGISGDRVVVCDAMNGDGVDPAAYIFDASSGAQVAKLATLSPHTHYSAVAISGDIVAALVTRLTDDESWPVAVEVQLFDADTGALTGKIESGPDQYFSPWKGIDLDGTMLTVQGESTLVFDIASVNEVVTLEGIQKWGKHAPWGVYTGAVVDGGRVVVIEDHGNGLGIYDLGTKSKTNWTPEVPCQTGFGGGYHNIIDADGDLAVLCEYDRVKVVDITGTWADFGGCYPNVSTQLVGVGALEPGNFVSLRIDHVNKAMTPVILVIGTDTIDLPLLGGHNGVLVPNPTWVIFAGYSNAQGEMEMHLSSLPVIPKGAPLYLQAFIHWPGLFLDDYFPTNAVRAVRM